MSPNRPSPLRTSSRLAALAVCSALLGSVIIACSSRDPFVTFGGGVPEEPAPPPSFTGTSDAGADVGPRTPPTTTSAGMCATNQCPTPYASCLIFGALAPYACGTNTATDTEHCGACGNACPRGSDAFHFKAACVDGECQPFCMDGWSDCNGIPDDGCESDPKTDSNNCGVCGNKCAAGVACVEGKCGCPPGQTNCDGVCVDLQNDDGSCGTCGLKCADNQPQDAGALPPNMFYGCHQGTCSTPRCYHDSNVFWEDCNGNLQADGCEVDLVQPNTDHCGKCGNQCTPSQQCFSTSETGMDCQCKGNKTLCPGQGWQPAGCADLENDSSNCGSCGYVCPLVDNADPICVKGRCTYTCQPGRADCNDNQADGCEVDLGKDPRHCGACGTSCNGALGQPCVGGQCATTECDGGIVK
jgi:hypothetical protein